MTGFAEYCSSVEVCDATGVTSIFFSLVHNNYNLTPKLTYQPLASEGIKPGPG